VLPVVVCKTVPLQEPEYNAHSAAPTKAPPLMFIVNGSPAHACAGLVVKLEGIVDGLVTVIESDAHDVGGLHPPSIPT
jgi:hypothetical protein